MYQAGREGRLISVRSVQVHEYKVYFRFGMAPVYVELPERTCLAFSHGIWIHDIWYSPSTIIKITDLGELNGTK